jgi:hypothetical protein
MNSRELPSRCRPGEPLPSMMEPTHADRVRAFELHRLRLVDRNAGTKAMVKSQINDDATLLFLFNYDCE